MKRSFYHSAASKVIWSAFIAIFLFTLQTAGQGDTPARAAPAEDGNPAPSYNAVPIVTLGVPAQAFISSNLTFSVTFNNNDPDPGYGPIIDLILPSSGADGDGDGLGTTVISASYLTSAFTLGDNMRVITFDAFGNATHPFFRDSSGAYITVTGTPGDKLVVLRLPFGSFTQDQPPATVNVTVNVDPNANYNTSLTIQARGGYEFGYTPLDDWCCLDAAFPGAVSGYSNASVTPTLFTLTKVYSGPEGEAATGPNFQTFYPLHYTVTVDIAPGQSITGLTLNDLLPADLQFYDLVASSPAGASCSEPLDPPPPPESTGGTLSCTWAGAVSGTASLTFDFYVPRTDGVSSIIDPVTGDAVTSCNNASITGGLWTPTDADDTGVDLATVPYNPGGCEYTLTGKSLAIQKGVTVVGGGAVAPGRILEYTLTFQVSDFFAFNNLVVTDAISDGQHFDPSFPPRLQVDMNPAADNLPSAAIDAANFDVSCNYTGLPLPVPNADCTIDDPASNVGTSTLTFRVSAEIDTRLGGPSEQRMVGGCVDPGTGSANPDCGSYNDGPTTATIVFRTVVQDQFTDDHLLPGRSGDPSVDQGDELTDTASVLGDLLDTVTFNPTGSTEADGSASTVAIGTGGLSKAIYAVNGAAPSGSPVTLKPGDQVTYRIRYVMPTGDEENLRFNDFLPLPVFSVADPDDNGTNNPTPPPFDPPPWSFDPTVSTGVGDVPASGAVMLGPDDTFYAYFNAFGGIGPVISTDTGNNSLTITYNDFDGPNEQPYVADFLFTVTVNNDPFADGLYLTNLANAYEGSTNAGEVSADSIVQIELTEPLLVTSKGVVASDNPNAILTQIPAYPASANFAASPGGSPAWTGTISSTDLLTTSIDSDITNVDAGDLVTFAIVIENLGSSGRGAFDITLQDTLPAGYQIPSAGAGLNLQIWYGDHAAGPGFTRPDNTAAVAADLFGTGIRIVDPGLAVGACQTYSPDPGRNVLIVTYDLEVAPTVVPGTIVNTHALINYAGTEGGPNHLPEDLNDDADTTVVVDFDKTFVNTEIVNANNGAAQAVIGELVTYQLVVTVPEGVVPAAQIVDQLDPGLAFVDIQSTTYSSGVTSTNTIGTGTAPANVTVGNFSGGTGNQLTFNFGDITDADRNNAVPDTITIVYRAVVLNVAGNQDATLLNNTAQFTWTGALAPLSASSTNTTVIEPVVAVTKGVAPASGDAGNTVDYTIRITGTTVTDAWEVTLEDTIPALVSTPTIFSVTDTASLVTAANFDLTGSSLTTVTPFDMSFNPGRQITIVVQGTISYSASPSQSIPNTARIRWSSLDTAVSDRSTYNPASDERTGTGVAPDDYTRASTATFVVNSVADTKFLMNTSELHTSTNGAAQTVAAIGEVIRYRLIVTLPEGTAANLQVRDVLPDAGVNNTDGHLLFLNDDTATLSFVSDDGITSTAVGIVPGLSGCDVAGNAADGTTPAAPLACILGDASVGSDNSTAGDPDSFAAGTDVFFKLGTLENFDSDADGEFIVIEFNALVANTADATDSGRNDAGELIRNTFLVTINGIQSNGVSNNLDVYAAEPALTVVKTAVIDASADAGDTVTFTLTVTAAGGNYTATAFELNLTDTLDANLVGIGVSSLTSTQPATCTGNGSGTTAFGSSSSVVGQLVTITATCLDPGRTITVTISSTVTATAIVGTVIPNSAALTYTGLPGDRGTLGNPTGSDTPGGSGTPTGERDDSGGATNHYTSTGSQGVTLASPAITKQITATSAAHTLGNDVAIGEVVTYALLLTLPEGTTPADIVLDDLPSGLELVGGSPQVITSAAASGGLLSADFNATIGTLTITPTLGDGGSVQYSFTNVVVAADNDTANNTLLLVFQARVTDILANQAGTSLSNVATNQVGANPATNSNTVTVTVVEPVITFTKTIVSTPTPLDAGGVVHYRISYANALGASTAMDVHITDALAAVLLLPSTGAPDLLITSSAGVGAVTNSSTASTIDITIASVLAGESVVVDFYPVIQNAITPAQVVNNIGTSTWTSLSGPVTGERTGAGGVDDYTATSNASFTSDGTIGITKQITATSAAHTLGNDVAIGEVVTYALLLTMPEGTTPADTVLDDIPTGLAIVAGSPQMITSAAASGGLLSADFNGSVGNLTITADTGDGGSVQYDFTNVIVAGDNITTNNTVLLVFQARVTDILANQAGTSLSNVATNQVGANPATNSNTVTVTVVEPVITFGKTIEELPSPLDAGGLVHYRISYANALSASTAMDVHITDALAAALLLPSTGAPDLVITPSGGVGAVTNSSTASTIDITIASVPAGESVIVDYYPVIQNAITVGQVVSNVGTSTWTSLSGPVTGERTGAGGVDDYITVSNASFTGEGTVGITKQITATSAAHTLGNDVAIGEVVTYALLLTLPEGTTPADTVLDDIPTGLAIVAGSPQMITSAAASGLLSADFNGSVGTLNITADTSDGGSVQYDFTNVVTNGDNITTNNTVLLVFQARVTDILANQAGTSLSNVATNQVGANPATNSNTVTVTVVEPVITFGKTIEELPSPLDAGGLVHYRISYANALGASTAMDVHITDALAAALLLPSTGAPDLMITSSAGVGAVTNSSTASTIDITIASVPAGESVVVDFYPVIQSNVAPSQIIGNTGHSDWTSLSGSVTGERTGAGGVDDYVLNTPNQTFQIDDPAFSKTLAEPSAIHTTPPNTAIGETFYFELTVTLPEGTTPSLVIVDDIPDGMAYIPSSVSLDTTGFIGVVGAPTITCPFSCGASGEDVTFLFGSITVTADNDDTTNDFIVRFQAVVVNELGNQAGDDLTNTATMTVSGIDYVDSDTVHLVEPLLTVTKTVTDIYPGASQLLTFTLTIQHDGTSTAGAFDVLIQDDLPVNLIDLSSITIGLAGGAAGAVDNSNLPTNHLEVTVATIPLGGTVTIQFQARVASGVSLGTLITNTAYVDWTSLPGDLATNPEERTSPGASPNDYTANGAVTLDVEKGLSKSISGTSSVSTAGFDVAIGEIVTYDVAFYVPVGATTAVFVTDTLSDGLAYVDCLSITPSAPGITTDAGGAPSNDFSGVCSGAAVNSVPPPGDSSAGRRAVFDFGDLDNSTGAVGSIVIRYRAVVLDVTTNQDGLDLNNSVQLEWSAGPLGTVGPLVNIVEPDLFLDKIVNTNTVLPNQVVTFTLTVAHTADSTQAGHDVLLTDIVPTGLTYVPGSLVYVSGEPPNWAADPLFALDDRLAPHLEVHWDTLPLDPVPTVIQFQATVGLLGRGQAVINTANLEWTSLLGNPGTQSIHNINSTERSYDPGSLVDIYGVEASTFVRVPTLPNTGFAPDRTTPLPPQPAAGRYAQLGDLWLEIPALGVKMTIVGVPTNSDGWDLTWLGNRAGYLAGTAYPTWSGNTGITGHIYMPNGKPGPFVDLHSMVWGQQVIVHMDGQRYIYEVRSVRRVWPDDISVLDHADLPTLTLITCQGYDEAGNQYLYRAVVRAVLVKIEPEIGSTNTH